MSPLNIPARLRHSGGEYFLTPIDQYSTLNNQRPVLAATLQSIHHYEII